MDHAATQEFDPAFARTNFTIRIFAFAEWAAQRKFKARLGEREIKWVDAHIQFLAVIFLQKLLQGGDQIADVDALGDIHAFNLVERVLVPRVQVFVAKHSVRYDGGNRLALFQIAMIFFQHAVLHGRGVRRRNQTVAVSVSLFGHEGIIIIARWVAFREIQTLEHMELIVNLTRLFRHKAHTIENVRNAVNLGAQRVNRAMLAW